METAEIVAGVVVTLAWLWLLTTRGGFWRVHSSDQCSTWNIGGKLSAMSHVAVVIPARNEAEYIGRSVGSLLQQDWRGRLSVFVVDDQSADGTAQAARAAAADAGKPGALTVIAGKPLPAGWSGKVWAMQQGLEAAAALSPDFFLFTDADVEHAQSSVSSLVTIAEAGTCDLASYMVRLHCASTAEKLLIPAFVFFFFKLYPPRWIADPGRASAGAAGGCILVRPQALAGAGGLEAFRNAVIDDCALARAVKRTGGKLWLGLASGTVSLRRYGSFVEIGRMIARTAFNQLHHSAVLLLAALFGLTLLYLAPIALLFTGHTLPVALGASAWAIMVVACLPMVRFYRLNPLWALTLPLASLFYMGATLWSAIQFWCGRGGQWKGRVQDRKRK